MNENFWGHFYQILSEELPAASILLVMTVLGQIFSTFFYLFRRLRTKKSSEELTFAEKLEKSVEQLKIASKDMDKLVIDITNLTSEKHDKLSKLEEELKKLSTKEEETRKKIEVLSQVPIEALQHFEEMMKPGEKKSAKRDYLLFAAGVIFSIISTIVLKLLGWA